MDTGAGASATATAVPVVALQLLPYARDFRSGVNILAAVTRSSDANAGEGARVVNEVFQARQMSPVGEPVNQKWCDFWTEVTSEASEMADHGMQHLEETSDRLYEGLQKRWQLLRTIRQDADIRLKSLKSEVSVGITSRMLLAVLTEMFGYETTYSLWRRQQHIEVQVKSLKGHTSSLRILVDRTLDYVGGMQHIIDTSFLQQSEAQRAALCKIQYVFSQAVVKGDQVRLFAVQELERAVMKTDENGEQAGRHSELEATKQRRTGEVQVMTLQL
ncbi:hypothetical protein ColLi_09113 [Colletotrichum liriopes]|uniref:Uncharacterized protein n=1 Tax=Colletotrichum liriopes TaxID=708192 RepID=A0AA37LUW4_9PEZI|nr:hypothetical protein ColLi_09113 [Colletotrichum liriopes]